MMMVALVEMKTVTCTPLVAVAELMVTASQRHVIPLQGRPYEEDQVRGMPRHSTPA